MAILSYLAQFLLMCWAHYVSSSPEFTGGSLSFTLKDLPNGNVQANVELITGWVLGTGPCGPRCSEADVGVSTQTSRSLVEQQNRNASYFGRFIAEFPFRDGTDPFNSTANKNLTTADITSNVHKNVSELLIAANQRGLWEQEMMKFSIEMPVNKSIEILSFMGDNWRVLKSNSTESRFWYNSNQNHVLSWQLEGKIHDQLRNDTRRRNSSPKVLTKAVYVVPLNKTTSFKIPAVEADGDYLRCFAERFQSVGGISSLNYPKGIVVHQDCTVDIEATSGNGFADGDFIAVPLRMDEENNETFSLGSAYLSAPGVYQISSIPIQFLVHIKQDIRAPSFVHPTLPDGHRFEIYSESTWRASIYALPYDNSTDIGKIVVTSRNLHRYQTTPLQIDHDARPHVKFVELSFTPDADTFESDIICISAVDSNGVETPEQLCYILEFKEQVFPGTQEPSNGPYFVDVPEMKDVVKCTANSTCILPIFIKSKSTVKNVRVTQSSMNFTKFNDVTKILHDIYKTELVVRHGVPGSQYLICIQAATISGEQTSEYCFDFEIIAPDPCTFNPCLNSGICKRHSLDSVNFSCNCQKEYYGTTCQNVIDHCDPNPCAHGLCFTSINPYYCYCSDDGINPNAYQGNNCTTFNPCLENPCRKGDECVLLNIESPPEGFFCKDVNHSCDFDANSICGWHNLNIDDKYDWLINTTGHQNGSLYINATDLSGHRALLQSKVIEVNANSTDFCLKFDYKVDGPNGGNLNVYVKHVQGFMPYHIWSRGRQQDSEWNTAQVAFSSADNFVIIFEGYVGNHGNNNLGLDSIIVTDEKHCPTLPPDATSHTPTIIG
ncbi:uncharacterized protein LOC127839050 [Dreissena polymorpha]|uniref:uncharacterized protein LOC127839050 n=1 Tax=Dreissena polymorpha TaxID=45954 RepID=UPI0022641D9E|nr:uncharacterized protein LOC127839050 [Dreissena polymorpha]